MKVVYNHTCFASYLHLRVGNVGSEYAYRLLEGSECFTAGGFPSNPILFGVVSNRPDRCPSWRGTRWTSSRACPSCILGADGPSTSSMAPEGSHQPQSAASDPRNCDHPDHDLQQHPQDAHQEQHQQRHCCWSNHPVHWHQMIPHGINQTLRGQVRQT